jgi:hypothetical protein
MNIRDTWNVTYIIEITSVNTHIIQIHTKKSALQNENIGVQNENFGYLF